MSTPTQRAGSIILILMLIVGSLYFMALPMWEQHKADEIKALLQTLPDSVTVDNVEVKLISGTVIVVGLKAKRAMNTSTTSEISIGRLTLHGVPATLNKEHVSRMHNSTNPLACTLSIDALDVHFDNNNSSLLATNLRVAPTANNPSGMAIAKFEVDGIHLKEGAATSEVNGVRLKKIAVNNIAVTGFEAGTAPKVRVQSMRMSNLFADDDALASILRSNTPESILNNFSRLITIGSWSCDNLVAADSETEVTIAHMEAANTALSNVENLLVENFTASKNEKPTFSVASLRLKKFAAPPDFFAWASVPQSKRKPEALLSIFAKDPLVIEEFTITHPRIQGDDDTTISLEEVTLTMRYDAGAMAFDSSLKDFVVPPNIYASPSAGIDGKRFAALHGKPLHISTRVLWEIKPASAGNVPFHSTITVEDPAFGKATLTVNGSAPTTSAGFVPFDVASAVFTGGKLEMTDKGVMELAFKMIAVENLSEYKHMHDPQKADIDNESRRLRANAVARLRTEVTLDPTRAFLTGGLDNFLEKSGTWVIESVPPKPIGLSTLILWKQAKPDLDALGLRSSHIPAKP